MAVVRWLKTVDARDFEAGQRYLELLFPPTKARAVTRALKAAPIRYFQAKDVLRASELAKLSSKDPEVAKQSKRIAKGVPLSPLLLVRESGHARLLVADGFHRLCAVVDIDATADVACKLA